MFQNASDLAAMAQALSRSTDYRVLRRLVPRPTSMPASGQETRIGILLDTETTGLDHRKDELIELGMVKFDYTPNGRIIGVRDTFSAFNEPSEPIPTCAQGLCLQPLDARGARNSRLAAPACS
ncbi:exonuclease domain-containing protein [Bradyrhizobium sp. 164]|uniref:exonuclease domain-containing protein n=1 Tax=Bradyrhizobium sp. 164 TaxID=2782637 RepID=UPI001FF830AC|nr:exonuclease domain-containing protein [Bradyrhizobium sp. 164]